MQVISVTLSDGEISFTMFTEDIERLCRIFGVPPALIGEEYQRFAEDMVKRAVFNDTGEPVMREGQG